jgi:hypothetical protein
MGKLSKFGIAIIVATTVFSVALIVRPDKFGKYLFYLQGEEILRAVERWPAWTIRGCGVVLLLAMVAVLVLATKS